jgi:hypothetical protein
MKHFASRRFWDTYQALPVQIRDLADKNHKLLEADPRHPSLHFKKVGAYWSVRIGEGYRAVGVDVEEGVLWIWIGTHAEYNRKIRL